MRFDVNIAGSYDPTSGGPYELSYSRIRRQSPAVNAAAIYHNSGVAEFSDGPSQHPIYQFRNSISRAPAQDRGVVRIGGPGGGWPVYLERDIWVGDAAYYLDNTAANAEDDDGVVLFEVGADPFDDGLDLDAAQHDAYLGRYGAQVAGPLSQ